MDHSDLAGKPKHAVQENSRNLMEQHLDRDKAYNRADEDDDGFVPANLKGVSKEQMLGLGGSKRLKNMKKHDILRLKNSDEAEKLARIEQDLIGHKELHIVQKPADMYEFENYTNREFNQSFEYDAVTSNARFV